MADNVAITAGSGTTIATDDIGGVQYQRAKLSLGADGTAVDAVAGAGAVGTGVQRVTLASDDPAVTALAAIGGYLDTEIAALVASAAASATAAKQPALGTAGSASADAITVQGIASMTPLLVSGAVAHDAADSGNPHKIGLQARTTWPTAVADADRVNAIGDKYGRQIVAHVPRGLRSRQTTTITSSTSETTIITAGASGVFLDVYKLLITNTSATACNVTIKDATAGTTVEIYAVAAGQTVGFTLPACDAMKQTTAANNWTATCSSSVASIVINAMFVSVVDA